jgi:hypothetical protein
MNVSGKSAIGLSHTAVSEVFRLKTNVRHPSVDAWRDGVIKEFVK